MRVNRILWLAMLSVASGSCAKLENLCSSDVFEYKGVMVNALHRVAWSVTLNPPSRYLINNPVKCDPFEFKDKTNFWEALRLKYE